MKLTVSLGSDSYNVIIEKNSLCRAGEYFNLNRKVMIVTDDGVPEKYAEAIEKQCKEAFVITVEQGEESKSFDNYRNLSSILLNGGFTRHDCVVAVGGGVVGDLAGFVCATYMRGIDFYNIPTTLLAQVDSSVGGKTAIDFEGVKNIIGAFHQPKGVLIDPEVLSTLDRRQVSGGMAEVIKSAVIGDRELFEILENSENGEITEEIISRALKVKIGIVEKDEKESGLRKILNFGHTLGHGIESETGLLHGESIAIGMMAVTDGKIRISLENLLKKYSLPTKTDADIEKVFSYISHDKKSDDGNIEIIVTDTVGECSIQKVTLSQFKDRAREVFI